MTKKVYVLMALHKDLFVQACHLHMKLNVFPGRPCQVIGSQDYAKIKCRIWNRLGLLGDFVYFYKEVYFYSD